MHRRDLPFKQLTFGRRSLGNGEISAISVGLPDFSLLDLPLEHNEDSRDWQTPRHAKSAVEFCVGGGSGGGTRCQVQIRSEILKFSSTLAGLGYRKRRCYISPGRLTFPAPGKAPTSPVPPTSPAAATDVTSCRFGWGNRPQGSLAFPSSVSASGPEILMRLGGG